MLGFAVEGDSSFYVQGSNIQRVAHFSSTLDTAYISIYGYDNSNVGYDIGVSNLTPNETELFIKTPQKSPYVVVNDSNVAITLKTYFDSNVYVDDTIYTSNLVVYSSVKSKLLPAPARKSFFVDYNTSSNDFQLEQSGYFLSHSSNTDIYHNGMKLRYMNDHNCEYRLTLNYDTVKQQTQYHLHLSQDAIMGDVIDIVVWPYAEYSNQSTLYQPVNIHHGFIQQSSSNLILENQSGNVGIGTNAPQYKLHVEGDIFSSYNMRAMDFVQTSDIRTKNEIEKFENALEKISELSGYTFVSKTDMTQKKRVGVIAQEVNKVLPELVYLDKHGYMSVAYGNMAGVFIEAIKELKDMVLQLTDRVNALEDHD